MFMCRISKLNFASSIKCLIRNHSFFVKSFNEMPNFSARSAKKCTYFLQNFYLPNLNKENNFSHTRTNLQRIHMSELDEFNAISKIIHDDFVECDDKALTDVMHWYSNVFKYNLENGKKNRGMFVLHTYKTLVSHPTADGLLSASILGWCLEMLHAYFLVADDIMDQSTTRRGKPCWYQKKDVGLIAINDAFMLEAGIYKILRKYFVNSPFYLDIMHEFQQVTEKTIQGQCLDMLSNPPNKKPVYEKFTLEDYKAIADYKTSQYSFCSPVRLGMHLVGGRTCEEFQMVEKLGVKLGRLFQIQDDYLDIYGVPEVTGKRIGLDIIDGKCTWFAVTFLENADQPMKKKWMENYGEKGENNISEVLLLYEKLNLNDKFKNYEKKLHAEIESMISNELTDKSMQELFFYILKLIYKRQK